MARRTRNPPNMDLARLRGLAADTVRHFDARVESQKKEFEGRVSEALDTVLGQLETHVQSEASVFAPFRTNFPVTVPYSVREAVAERLRAMGFSTEWEDFYLECDEDEGCTGAGIDQCSFCRRNFFLDESNWLPNAPGNVSPK